MPDWFLKAVHALLVIVCVFVVVGLIVLGVDIVVRALARDSAFGDELSERFVIKKVKHPAGDRVYVYTDRLTGAEYLVLSRDRSDAIIELEPKPAEKP